MRGALKESLRAWPRALPYLKAHRPLVIVSFVLMAGASAVALLEPWPLAVLIDSVLGDKPLPGPSESWVTDSLGARVGFVVVLMLLVTLAAAAIQAVIDYVNTKIEMRMILDFRSDLFQHVQRLSFDYHDDRKTGEFMGRINGQASSLGAVTVAAFPLAQSALTLVGMFYIAYRLNPPIALVSLSVVPFIYYSAGYYGSRIGPEVRKVKSMEIRSLHLVHEAVQMIRVIVAFNREKEEFQKFRSQGEEAVDARIKVTVKQSLFSGAVGLITAAGTAAVLGVGAYQVRSGKLSVGELLVVLAYIRAVYTPLETISNTLNSIQESLIGFEMALELLETQPEVVEKPDAIDLGTCQGRVECNLVGFTYEGREHTLQEISFAAQPGESVAIVGPTGAGKSTLMSLLPRFYDVDTGCILLDGVDIRDATLDSLRRQFSIVLQEPLLFSGTIEDNIRYARPEATKEEVIAAAQAANAHDFIQKLPRKYRTKLGERGAKLSGGERQRIAVARAFLKDAPILILDEPTSSIDSRTEAVILEALSRLMKGRTTLMIAHRLSTVRNADQIVVLNEGELVERGTHEELLASNGLYRLLYEAQSGHDVGFFAPALAAIRASAAGEGSDAEDDGDRPPTVDETVAALRAVERARSHAPARDRADAAPPAGDRPRRKSVRAGRPLRARPVVAAPVSADGQVSESHGNGTSSSSRGNGHGRPDLNQLGIGQLVGLPGIGPVTAKAILRRRDQLGGFRSLDDLDGAEGIRPTTLAKLRDLVTVGDKGNEPS